MATDEIEILDNAVNAAVVQMPGRKFPLCVLYKSAPEMEKLCQGPNRNDARDVLSDLLSPLAAYVGHYERVLDAHSIERRYPHESQD